MNLRGVQFSPVFDECVIFARYSQLNPRRYFLNNGSISRRGAGVVLKQEIFFGFTLSEIVHNKKWNLQTTARLIPIVSRATTSEERISEICSIMQFVSKKKTESKKQFGVVLFFEDSSGDEYELLADEIEHTLAVIEDTDIPLVVAVSLSFPPDMLQKISAHKNCDAIFVRPYVNWDQIPNDARKVFFRIVQSPFAKNGGGYVYGKYVRTFSLEWARQAKSYMSGKPLIIGGGILGPHDVLQFARAGVHGVVVDDATRLRFWNSGRIVRLCKKIFV